MENQNDDEENNDICVCMCMYRYVYMQYERIECGLVWFDRLYQEFLTKNGTLTL